jgi:hypothetical protein
MCKSKNEQLSTWMDWIWSSRCLELLCTSTQPSHLKWVSGGGINSPRHSKSRWLTTTEKVSIRWTNVILFKASVHPVPLPRHIVVEVLWQNCSDGASVHPVLKDASPNPYCMYLRNREIDRRFLWSWRRFIRCWRPRLGASLYWFKLSVR